jgi:truncated hemoglobin YjbI
VPLPTTLTTPALAATASRGALTDVDEAALVPLLAAFYDTIGREPMLAPYFAPLDMRAHIPRIADFWSTLLFHSGRYEGNALATPSVRMRTCPA